MEDNDTISKKNINSKTLEEQVLNLLALQTQQQQEHYKAIVDQTTASLREEEALKENTRMMEITTAAHKEKIKYDMLHIESHERQTSNIIVLIEVCQNLLKTITENNNRFIGIFEETIRYLSSMTAMLSSNLSTEQKVTLESMLKALKTSSNIIVSQQSVTEDWSSKIHTGDVKMGSNFNINSLNAQSATLADTITNNNNLTNSSQVVGTGNIKQTGVNPPPKDLEESLKVLSEKMESTDALKNQIDSLLVMVKASIEKKESLDKSNPLINIIESVVNTIKVTKQELGPFVDSVLKFIL